MPRSNWKGVISFGLVSIPIMLFPAENKSADISFHQIDKRNKARIKYKRINTVTGKEVPWEEIGRGYEYDKETTIPVPDELLKKVAGSNARAIDIETFINKSDLNMLMANRTYYLVPDKKGEKGYVILRDALSETKKVGIAKVIISTKEYLAAVIPYEDALALCLLKYEDEMRSLSEFDLPSKGAKVTKKEMDIAKKLIVSMTTKWRPERYKDEYQVALHKWVENAAKHLPTKVMKQRQHAKPSNVVNFVDLLKKSLSTSKQGRGKSKVTPVAKATRGERYATRH